MGNICRSPTAEAVLHLLVQQRAPQLAFEVDSAGTHAYHVGEPPDLRSQRTAAAHGTDMSSLRARVLRVQDFSYFDQIVVMDRDNLAAVMALRPTPSHAEVHLLLDFLPDQPLREVPDPYYGKAADFEQVYQLCNRAAEALLAHWVTRSAG